MKDFYCLDIEFPGVDFNKYYIKCDDVCQIHHAHIFSRENEIELRIFYDPKTYFGERITMWSQQIGWRKFGSLIKINYLSKNNRLLKIDLSESNLLGIQNSTNNYAGNTKYVVIKLDCLKLYWKPAKEKINTAEFYLSDVGFRVVEPFYTNLFGFDGKFNLGRMKGMNIFYSLGKSKFRPEFNTYSSDERSRRVASVVKEPRIQFKYTKSVTEAEAVFYGDVVSNLASFYHHIKIEYRLIRINLLEYTITIKKILEKNNFDISGSLIGLKNNWSCHEFLKSKWQKETLKKFKLLSKSIELFNQALLVDSNSEFLIRYNIIEICNNLKQDKDKFKFSFSEKFNKKKFDEALELLLETIDLSEHEQFKNKWTSLSGKLEYKPMISPLVKFLESQNLKTEEFPISVSELKELRNNITHGSIEKIKVEELRKANQLLYRINGILILNLIGIKEWKLNIELT